MKLVPLYADNQVHCSIWLCSRGHKYVIIGLFCLRNDFCTSWFHVGHICQSSS